jgi:hypothetical protein
MGSFLTKRQIETRWVALDIACEDFVTGLRNTKNKAYAYGYDGALLYDALISTYEDIQRYKDWHQDDPANQKSDSIKRAAYFTKWLIRLHPIWVEHKRPYRPSRDDTPLLLNEKFTLRWAFANLGFELGQKFPVPTKRHLFDLLYLLHYRSVTDDALIQIFQLMYDTASGQPLYVKATDLE